MVGNASAMPEPDAGYWSQRVVPHLVSVGRWEVVPACPSGDWRSFVRTCQHSTMGGATDALCSLCLFLPSSRVANCAMQHPLPTQGWSSLDGCVDPVTSARDVPEERPPPASPQQREGRLVWKGGDLLPWGLFPSDRREVMVRVRCVYNKPSGWGRRRLTVEELAALWDVPILWREWAGRTGLNGLLQAFTDSVPGKCLVLGGDYLLTSCYHLAQAG